MKIPFCDLSLQHKSLETEIEEAIRRVIRNSSFILGPEVDLFEQRFAEYIGVKHAIGTSSGTTSLLVALKALQVGPGDEVIVPAMTFFATAEVVAFLGARPVFVDIDEKTLNINTRKIREHITPRTKLIIPVHLYGQPAEMREIRNIASEFHLKVLGDCAHAHGARYGNAKVGGIEDIAAFSFYPSKNLGCLGEAGMITTNDDELAVWCRRYRDHGSTKKFEHTCVGLNARMDGLSAAVLSTKLTYLDEWNEQRRTIARSYNSLLSGLPIQTPFEMDGVTHVYHIYQIRLLERDKAAEHLMRHGVSTTLHYPVAMHLHPGFSYLQYSKGDFPVAEQLARETLSLPCFPGMTQDQVAYVATCLKEFCHQAGF